MNPLASELNDIDSRKRVRTRTGVKIPLIAFFAVTLKNLGHAYVEFHEMPGVNHGQTGNASAKLIANFIRHASGEKE
jgi:hypothetical protein